MKDQVLDSMDLERGKEALQLKVIRYKCTTGIMTVKNYVFNLIDTPGHVDFSYEVSRSLAACEGVLLLVDAAQGVEAQQLAILFSRLKTFDLLYR